MSTSSAVRRRVSLCVYVVSVFAFLAMTASAWAHKPSDSYLNLEASGREVHGQWDIALRDLDYAIGLDADDDGAITWKEVSAREADIAAYALPRLRLSSGGSPCPLHPTALLVDNHSDGAYAVVRFAAACDGKIDTLTAEYRLFFDLDPQHRGLASVRSGGATRTAIFAPESALQRFDLAVSTPWRQFAAFVSEGIAHIGAGIDHLLFLLALLLPSMFERTKSGWKPVANVREALWSVVRIVTSFTVAHSITLSLAVTKMVALPSRWVETAIAATVLLAALNNLYPVVGRRLWLVAFGFGLIHGFGFASVLLDMGLPRDALLLSLFGFNLGVEIGQLIVVAIYFAIAWAMRSTRLYGRAVLSGGSAAVALVAVVWMVERGFDLKIF